MTTGDWAGLDAAELLDLLRRMVEIRTFENQVMKLFAQNRVRASTHLCQGQEAVAVGVCSALEPGDTMTCTYRGHGAVLAMGAPLDRTMGEILGRKQGLCAGRGGSMHLTDISVGALGSFAIVGAHLPFSCGTALASQYLDSGSVTACFFGDGATNIGAFHEALNLAAVWALPIIFVCENNLYGEYSPIASTTPITRLCDRAKSYAMLAAQVDGNDVLAVRSAAAAARTHAAAGDGPTMIEALTYRQVGHSRTDPGSYRPAGELEEWLEKDPIQGFEARIQHHGGVTPRAVAATKDDAVAAVNAAVEKALSWPEPDPSERFAYLAATQ
jgi:TPP-dependent pyruvate/acetoin dehydrogenase alpha subunit